ncbi:glycosyltransferase family 2 protein [Yersinia mollaretii]|uniref:Glycosyltransferase family 2 protein n=1 Tax=Yersinia mollaretii TaxID=33060 RepID=A0AA44CJN6_YERMO|nr:glycosyltransferase [Yersinia mollaretii]NIL21917.1 glycosyltransferase family 2 protein [Yersinia mollaretii]
MELSICIPTYNRSGSLIKQINFVLEDAISIMSDDMFEIIISDNKSDDEHHKKIIKEIEGLKQKYPTVNLYYFSNKENVGLVRNLKVLANIAKGKYIWFVGDDDEIHKGIISKILPLLNENKGMVFINHRAVDKDNNILMDNAFIGNKHKSLYEIFKHSNTTMMFITACVYKKEFVDEVFENEDSRLSLPFYLSFYCFEKSGATLVNDIMIDNYWGDTSWSDSSWIVFSNQIPRDIFKIIKESKNKKDAVFAFYPFLIKTFVSIAKHKIFKFIKFFLKKNDK